MIQSKPSIAIGGAKHIASSSTTLPIRCRQQRVRKASNTSSSTNRALHHNRPSMAGAVDANSALATSLLARVDEWTFGRSKPSSMLEKLRKHNDVLADQARSLKQGCANDAEAFSQGRRFLLQQIQWLMDDLETNKHQCYENDSDRGPDYASEGNSGWATV